MSSVIEEHGSTTALVQQAFSNVLHSFILYAFCHSIYTCVFFATLYYICFHGRDRKRIIAACIVTFMWTTQTIFLMLNWQTFYGLFIAHGTTLDSKFDYYFLQGDTVLRIAIYDLLQGLNIFLADLILIWRCWVLYGGNWRIASILAGCLIIEIVSACVLVVFDCTTQSIGLQETAWIFIYYSITVVTNCFCTFLILYRIVRVSGVLASLRTYRGIIEMLIESAFVYSAIYIAYLVVFGCEATSPFTPGYDLYPANLSNSITGIAPTLIIGRVMAGKARPNDSWTRPSLPHMSSNMQSLRESLHFASAPHTPTGLSTTGVDLEEGEVTSGHELEPERIEAQGEE